MGELLIVENPRHRRKSRRNPHRRRHARRGNPHRRHRRHARSNPHRRHRRHHGRRINPHRRRRSNPMSLNGVLGQVKPVVKEGFIQAAGAIGLDAVWGQINSRLPAQIQGSPYLQFAVKCLAAVGVGWLGGKVFRGRARDFAVGGVTVAAHDLLKSTLQSNMPSVFGAGGSLALSGYGSYLSGSAPIVGTATFPRTRTVPQTTFGAYLSGSSGSSDGAGVYSDDCTGFDPWGDGA